MANSHTGHWVSVQGLMGHQNTPPHIQEGVCSSTYIEATHTEAHLCARVYACIGSTTTNYKIDMIISFVN